MKRGQNVKILFSILKLKFFISLHKKEKFVDFIFLKRLRSASKCLVSGEGWDCD